jgi:hypothetical protein
MGWGDVRYCFAMAILVLIIILPHIFVRSISRRCLDQTLCNLVGISYGRHFEFVQPPPPTPHPHQLPHTIVDIPTKFDEV